MLTWVIETCYHCIDFSIYSHICRTS